MQESELKYFKERVCFWRDKFNLNDFSLSVIAGEVEDDAIADVKFDMVDRWAIITIDNNIEGLLSKRILNRVAFHEIMELRLGGLRSMMDHYYHKDIIDEEIHIVIRVFENLLK